MLLSIASARLWAEGFRAGPAASYAHQTADQITVGAKAFGKPELVEEAFGKKVDLLKYGVVPVLLVVENKGKASLDLQNLEINLVATDGRHAAAVTPDELLQLGRPGKRTTTVNPLPFPLPKKKNPMQSPELVTQAFAAKMLPPGETASGFVYFEAKPEKDDKLYVNGIREARTGREVLYFEFPLEQ